MSWINSITPEDTEEVKPGLFIQKKLGKYRLINPAAWDGKIIWKNLLFGGQPFKHLFIFILIVGLAWAYQSDIQSYQDFYLQVRGDPIAFCAEVKLANNVVCTEENEKNGLCIRDISALRNFSLGDIVVINDESS